jgi:protein required for attachment to host cells
MTTPVWVVVSSRTTARFLAASSPLGELRQVEAMEHPEGRLHARELTSDLPGRAFDSKGGGRHALENEVDPERHEAVQFARRVAARLESARVRGEVERLILIAPPEFLGFLRSALTAPTRNPCGYPPATSGAAVFDAGSALTSCAPVHSRSRVRRVAQASH